jgi:hypothetical protein
LVAVALALLAAGFFDRFDPAIDASRHPPPRTKQQTPTGSTPGRKHERMSAGVLPAVVRRFSAPYLVLVELRVLLKGARPFWYLVALALAVGGFFTTSPAARGVILLLAWIWPVLIWSAMGCREAREGTSEVAFSCPHPLRMFAAQWLAGVIVAVLASCGVLFRLISSDDTALLGTWGAAVVFIPSLALMFGVMSGTSKLFEVTYVLLCYVGPLNGVAALDFIGMGSSPSPLKWLGLSAISVAIALSWRWRRLNH